MVDFFKIATRESKKGRVEIYPKFIVRKSKDLMIRGGDFYAVWLEDEKRWSKDEQDAIDLIDNTLKAYSEEHKDQLSEHGYRVLYLWDSESKMIDKWHKYCKNQMIENYQSLDERLIFSNSEIKKTDYASKSLDYPLEAGSIEAYDRLVSVLYSPEERQKLEWAIGSIVCGDSTKIQKFCVLYGSAGTGKSTVLNIIQKLFKGYYSVFDAKALGSSSNSFALEPFKDNPLVAIQHDGDLSRIEDNTRINSLVSHEQMPINEKFTKIYTMRFNAFLFMGTNKPVKITDAKSGLIRRLIDISPTGDKVSNKEYKKLYRQIDFELGAIAEHCKNVYLENKTLYDDYIPINMMSASNDFYNFIADSEYILTENESITLSEAWPLYQDYCNEAKVLYPFSKRVFKEELKNYFYTFDDRKTIDGRRSKNVYSGFRYDKLESKDISDKPKESKDSNEWLVFKDIHSLLDDVCREYKAQYAPEEGRHMDFWDDVKTTLSDLDTSKVHYVRLPENHIVIDFDISDENGKSLAKNLVEANKWPKTYAELSKSGGGIHLHYIYDGDVTKLKRIYNDHIEIKVFTGKSSLRRRLSKCNDIPITTINSGLPLRKDKPTMISKDYVKSQMGLINTIKKCINKEYENIPSTKSNIDYLYKVLEETYKSGQPYDVSKLRPAVDAFASQSTNNRRYCIDKVRQMKFRSEEPYTPVQSNDNLVFFDTEVYKNLFLLCWKYIGDNPVIKMFNPTPKEVLDFITNHKIIGYNNKNYDNHILYARGLRGFSNEQLYNLSARIVGNDKNAKFRDANAISESDVYDFISKKQSLKRYEIDLGIDHKEMDIPWDQPAPEDRWEDIAEYCANDVIATEKVFLARKADWDCRKILADISGGTVNDSTNALTTRFIFNGERNPQTRFNYRNLGDMESEVLYSFDEPGLWYNVEKNETERFEIFNSKKQPIFPGYVYDFVDDSNVKKSMYRGEEVGEGGYVYAEPGMYGNVALLDIASMHPSTIIAELLFGPYTARFKEIYDARIAIKHKDFDRARKMLDGKLAKYLDNEESAKNLAQALKIAINSVYGLTAAKFQNAFKDPRNIDNIVAKRGALFMVNLKHAVQEKGYTVAHIKTDSIKIPDADDYIINFVQEYGKAYGYNFEHEATYDRMCLVNDAVYIAKYKDSNEWTATGKQFQVPYVYKKLFSKEPIQLEDLCQTFNVNKGDLYLDMNESLPDVSAEEKELEKIEKQLKKDILELQSETDHELSRCLEMDIKDKQIRIDELKETIKEGHNHIFVGRVGSFCPVRDGTNGGILQRYSNEKYYSVPGSLIPGTKTPYRFKEAQVIKTLGLEHDICIDYYDTLADKAVDEISKYGDFAWFVSDDPYVPSASIYSRQVTY